MSPAPETPKAGQHTAGPWRLEANAAEAGWLLVADENVVVAGVYMHGPTTLGPSARAEVEANRDLIAAAPALASGPQEMRVTPS